MVTLESAALGTTHLRRLLPVSGTPRWPQARQLWSYIDSQMEGLGQDQPREVCPGIIFPRRPADPGRLRLIEQMFEAEGIPVVWEDETVEQRQAR